MRAVVVRRFGGPEVLEVADVPVPEPGPGQVRIRVEAAAVNPVDAATRAGALAAAGLMTGELPVGLGWDAAGVIDAVGPSVAGVAGLDGVGSGGGEGRGVDGAAGSGGGGVAGSAVRGGDGSGGGRDGGSAHHGGAGSSADKVAGPAVRGGAGSGGDRAAGSGAGGGGGTAVHGHAGPGGGGSGGSAVHGRAGSGGGGGGGSAVHALGSGVGGFAVGDRVVGLSDRLELSSAAQAEFVVLDASAVARCDLDPVEAATLPLNVLTAAQALDLLSLTEGQTVLVTGAAGAVGGFAVELAAARGLRVVALAGDGDEDLVRELGASVFVPRSAPLAESVRRAVPGGVDGVLDAAVLGVRALDALRGGGAFASVIAGAMPPALRGTRVANVFARADGPRLATLLPQVTPRVADTLPLAEVAEAHRRLDKGALRGRLVLTL